VKFAQINYSFMQYAEKHKSICLTMITSFGLKHAPNSYIVQHELTLADLFNWQRTAISTLYAWFTQSQVLLCTINSKCQRPHLYMF